MLSPQQWPFRLENLPQPAYLVGGAVRDALLERQREYLDLDFVLPANAVKTARQIAKQYHAGFVLLDAERQIARVVFENATADFAQQEGNSLETDLNRRDFTINAIAYNPHTQEFIDPLNGQQDLQAGLIRMVRPANLEDDPLRLLRAYRQAGQLGFTIDSATRSAIRAFAPLLETIAAERVRTELYYLLATSQGTPQLQAAWEDQLLKGWFPSATAQHLERLAKMDEAAGILSQRWPALETHLQQHLRNTIKVSYLALAKLAGLLDVNPQIAEQQLLNLKYSRAELQTTLSLIQLLPKLSPTPETLSIREQYFIFRHAGIAFPALAVVALSYGVSPDQIAPLMERYLNPDDLVAHPVPLLSGKTLMSALNLPAGPKIGQLLTELEIARAQNQITTPEAALKFAQEFLKSDE